jgi:hypothetical protein
MPDTFTLHKPIRNRIRQYERDAMLNIAMTVLLENEKEIPHFNGYVPWECMLLIRWILQYGSPGKHLKPPTIPIVNSLLNDIKELYNHPSANRGLPLSLHKFMRRSVHQQLSYQVPPHEMKYCAGRQIILFTEIGEKYGVNQKFEEKTGLSITDFLGISVAVFSILLDNTCALKPKFLYPAFDPDKVQKYFDLVAVEPVQAKTYLDEDAKQKKKRFVFQLYEVSPLWCKLFLKKEDGYVVFSKCLFQYFFVNFIYDFLYNLPDRFDKFGDIFEKYVRQQLETQGFLPILDKSWTKILGKNISAPDFTICQDDATIFIETKRKHLQEDTKILQTNDAFACHLDDSVVKGVLQIYSLANEILKSRPERVKNFDNFYGVVVSYKNDYLRGGQQFWDEFLRDEVVPQLNERGIDPNLIPPENILVLPIDEMDDLMAFLAVHPNETFGSIFAKVKKYEADPAQRSYFFVDYLKKIAGAPIPGPAHLGQKFDSVTDNIVEIMECYEESKKESSPYFII